MSVCHIIMQNSLDVTQSHIKPKKQGKKNSRGEEARGVMGWKNLKKEGVRNIGSLHKTWVIGILYQLYSCQTFLYL